MRVNCDDESVGGASERSCVQGDNKRRRKVKVTEATDDISATRGAVQRVWEFTIICQCQKLKFESRPD